MASKAATWLAFHSVVKRGLTTATPTRFTPRPNLSYLPPHQTLVSKATKSRKLPKNHFTSNTVRRDQQPQQLLQNELRQQQQPPQPPPKTPKRKAAQRTQAPSLRRVAVEAQRSKGSLIIGRGKTRHVDPEVDTKNVTAYCGAETYNVHVARDLLRREGWEADPMDTALFPQVLHVRTPTSPTHWRWSGGQMEGVGDVFIFPSGSVVTWNVGEKMGRYVVERVLLPAAENSHVDKLEAEDLEYLEDPTREDSEIIGDTIILGTKAPSDSHLAEHDPATSSGSTDRIERHEVDTLLTQIAFSSALARSTKLAVLENSLAHYFQSTHDIPFILSKGKKPRFTRAFILRKTGELLSIRAQLNLYSELTDSLPDLFWDSPHELGLESYYDAVGRALDIGVRIKTLNEKMDYASEIAAVLRERLSEKHSHLLEWIIIWLILIEVAYGSLHLWRERQERLLPDSDRNLMRAYLLRQLEKDRDGRV